MAFLLMVCVMAIGMPDRSVSTPVSVHAGFGTQRPNLVGDPNLPAGERSVNRWFNTAAFEPAPAFTIGTSSGNPIGGPGYRILDLAVMRRVRLSGARALEVRGEIFNVTNRPDFMAPNTDRRLGGVRHDYRGRRPARHPVGAETSV